VSRGHVTDVNVMSQTSMRYFARMDEVQIVATPGWRRLIGYLKLQVIFRKRATNYRALLWKVTYEDKGTYESSPPCTPQEFFLFAEAYTISRHVIHRVKMRHFTHIYGLCNAHERVVSFFRKRRAKLMNERCHAYG